MSRGAAAQRALYRIARIAYPAGVGLLSDMRGYLQRVQAGSTSSRADGYVLVLEDGGPGIPEPQRATLFENGRSTHKHGTGHGLALVREVVEQDFSGSVHHETSPLGGARFVLRFPIPNEAT